MNTLAKCFIVINLVLSVLYAAFQVTLFANRQDWKQSYSDEQEKFVNEQELRKKTEMELTEALKTKEIDFDQLNDKKNNLSEDLDEAKTQVKESVDRIAKLEQRLNELDSNYQLTVEKLTKSAEENSQLRNDLQQARETASNASSELVELREQIVAFQKERSRLNGDLEITASAREELEGDLKKLQYTIGRLEAHGVDIASIVTRHGEPEKPVYAKVLAVRPESDIVLLSVGSKDLVKEGFRFTIYSGGTYKGKVQVESVLPSMCSAKILKGLLAESQTIQEGDNASTRIY